MTGKLKAVHKGPVRTVQVHGSCRAPDLPLLYSLYLERMEEDRMPKISSLKNWKRRVEEEDPGKDEEKKWKEILKCWE
jgi:4-alpha-glucanotransferase